VQENENKIQQKRPKLNPKHYCAKFNVYTVPLQGLLLHRNRWIIICTQAHSGLNSGARFVRQKKREQDSIFYYTKDGIFFSLFFV
jgi:hypothetical protein